MVTFLDADFFVAGFLRATVFFFADTFFLLTVRLVPADFDLLTGLRLAAFFREPLASLCLLLAVFFTGISASCRSEKNAQLYIDEADMEAFKTRQSTGVEIGRESGRQYWKFSG